MAKLRTRVGRLATAWVAVALLVAGWIVPAPAHAQVPANTARIHYHRIAGDYAGWVIYTWTGALNPSTSYPGSQGPTASDTFGVYYDVALQPAAPLLNFILTNGASKNCASDMALNLAAQGYEIWQLQDDCTIYTSPPAVKVGDTHTARAHWLTASTIAWPGADPADSYRLYYAAAGGITTSQTDVIGGAWIPLAAVPGGLDASLQAKYPNLAAATAIALQSSDLGKVPDLLKGEVVAARFHGGQLADATALQIPGVLDSLYLYGGRLGAVILRGETADDPPSPDQRGPVLGLQFRVWAPTATSVKLDVFASPTAPLEQSLSMQWHPATGVWSIDGNPAWVNNKYYLYEVTVYVRDLDQVATNVVTDPYSLGLSVDSQRSLVVDLASDDAKPAGWQARGGPVPGAGGGALSIYELHVRDFSAGDPSVPAADRGKFLAFTHKHSLGMTHLRELARAGLTYIHVLPAFDFSSVPEDPSNQLVPAIPNAAPDSSAQQAAVGAVRDRDAFNWGYDPWHYTTPEGSYASDPNGLARVREFRAMVEALHDAGLKVVMDVVYNHTSAAGQNPVSVLDRIVPGYYHRLDDVGKVLSDSCCADTAAEHAMFEKLMIDSTEVWVRDYGIDAFRFDLMSFHPRDTMLRLRAHLQQFAPDIYIYGEGWNFGAIGNNARFIQASQLNLAGTGLGTFSDRLRDGVRGGGPFDNGTDLVRNQGFINGLWYDNNDVAGAQNPGQRDWLAHLKDLIMLGMAGNLRDFMLVDKDGNLKKGSEIDYFGQPAAYCGSPTENIVYASAHDNQTLFDISQYKLPAATSLADRVRVQTLGLAIIALSQGVSFFHAGDDLLRSKSFDNNSYDSGDWFNRLDFTYQSNNFGVGLPPAWSNDTNNWPVMAPFLRNAAITPGFAEIDQTRRNFLDLLEIRGSTPLLNLGSAAQVTQRVKFYNTGPAQDPALIVMAVAGDHGGGLLMLINANPTPVTFVPMTAGSADYAGTHARLHKAQREGADPVVRSSSFDRSTGAFTVPARTAAVFVVDGG